MLSVSANRRCQPWFRMPGCSWRCQGHVCRVDMTWHELSRSFAHGTSWYCIRWNRRFSKDFTLWIHLTDCMLQEKYSSRFASRTARTQRIGWAGKERGLFGLTRADWGQTWPSLALSWAEQEPAWANVGVTCAELRPLGQLGPNWGPTWRNLGIGLNMRNLVLCGCLAGTPSKPKNVGNRGENASFQRGPKRSRTDPNCDARGSPSQVQHAATWNTLATASAQQRHNMKRGTRGLTISYWAGHVPTWAEVAPKWAKFGPGCVSSWSQVGPKLEPSGSKLGRFRPKLRRRCCGHVGFGRCWTVLQHVQITTGPCTFWRPGRTCACTPQLTVRSHPLLNYHTSAPSVRADFYGSKCSTNWQIRLDKRSKSPVSPS